MKKVLKKNKNRFIDFINNVKNTIVVTSKSLSGNKYKKLKHFVLKNNFLINMYVKKLFYYQFISKEREKNQKVPFNGDMFFISPKENANYNLLNSFNSFSIKINGVIYNNEYNQNYHLFLKSKFDKNRALIMILTKLATLLFSVIKNIKKYK